MHSPMPTGLNSRGGEKIKWQGGIISCSLEYVAKSNPRIIFCGRIEIFVTERSAVPRPLVDKPFITDPGACLVTSLGRGSRGPGPSWPGPGEFCTLPPLPFPSHRRWPDSKKLKLDKPPDSCVKSAYHPSG